MNALLDTHVLLWMFGDPARVSKRTRSLLDAPTTEVFASIVSLWEIALKRRMGKLDVDVAEIAGQLAPAGKVRLLTIEVEHLDELGLLPVLAEHRDLFDHLLIAQAISEDMAFVSADRNASLYDLRVIEP